ncbi:hypothetical protein [Halogranum rubrum]|nr:hypothetical protein [Halogranum salarium]
MQRDVDGDVEIVEDGVVQLTVDDTSVEDEAAWWVASDACRRRRMRPRAS